MHALQLRIAYVSAPSPPAATDQPGARGSSADGSGGGGGSSMGRRMALPLEFSIKPTLSLTALSFMEQYAPLLDGARVPGLLR